MSVSEQPLVACSLSTGARPRPRPVAQNIRVVSPGLKAWHASLFGNTFVMIWCSAFSTCQRPLRRCAEWSSRSGYAAPSWPLILISQQMRYVSQSPCRKLHARPLTCCLDGSWADKQTTWSGDWDHKTVTPPLTACP